MLRLKKFVLGGVAASALVLSFSALTGTTARADSDKGICSNIFSPFKCNQASICSWDDVEGRCEQTTRGSVGCYSYRFPGQCSADPNCAWDDVEGRCESIH